VARPDERILYYDNSEFAQKISELCESVMPKKGEKTLHAAVDVATTLGFEAAHRYIKGKRFKKESFDEQEKLKKLLCIALEYRGDFPISYKFNYLCDEIRDLHSRHEEEFCGIIFVERRATCRMLCELLKDVDFSSEIRVGFFHGQGSTKYTVVSSKLVLGSFFYLVSKHEISI
jgi:ERCC4-related helicase